mgnify:CR=1 FL=1
METKIVRKGHLSKEIQEIRSVLNNLITELEGICIPDEKVEEIKSKEIEFATSKLKNKLPKIGREYYLNKIEEIKKSQLVEIDYLHALGQITLAEGVIENLKYKFRRLFDY